MKIRNYFSCVCAAFIAALSLVGCSDYDNGYTEQQINFIKNFKEIYGEVDPTQDWNLAERAKVTVTVSKPSNIQIYAKANDKYRIVGDYDDVSGTQTLGFDVVEGTTDIMVSDGRTAQKTTVGGSVTFAGTRTIYNTDFTTKTDDDQFLILTDKEFIRWSEYVPEKQFNLGKVTEDFIFVSTGPFTIYPVWWNTSNNNELGIYILGDDGKPIEKPIYQIKPEDVTDTQGNSQYGDKTELMYWAPGGHHDENGNWQADAGWAPATGGEPAFTVSFDDNGKLKLSTDENSNTPSKIRARGITVNLEPGTLFGMYLRESARSTTGKTYYSNSLRNEKYYGLKYNRDPETGEVDLGTIENDHNSHASYACTFTDGGRMYLGFEDWEYLNGYTAPGTYLTVNNTDFDLNDCLFVFGDDTPEIVDLDAMKWIISAEDLGNTLDIDYNDVVIEVEHTSGRKNAYVTPLAAGGTLASFVYFNDIPVGSADYGKSGEIHELFSSKYAKAKSGEYEPINVKSTKQQIYSTRNYTIEVGRNWSLASNVPDYEVYGEDGATLAESFDPEKARTMGGFNVRVVPYGKDVNASNANDVNAQRIQNTSTTGEAPFVICTPKYWTRADNTQKGHYRWPMESVLMFKAYNDDNVDENEKHEGHTFQKWVADKDDKDGKVWYQYPNALNTCAPTVLGINPEDSFKDIVGSGDSGSGGITSGPLEIGVEYPLDYTPMDNLGNSINNTYKVSFAATELPEDFTVEAELTIAKSGTNNGKVIFYSDVTSSTMWGSAKIMETYSETFTVDSEILKKIFDDGGFVIGVYDGDVNRVTIKLKLKE